MAQTKPLHYEESREQLELNDNVRTELFGRVTCPPGYFGRYHSHDFWELVYIYKTAPDPFIMDCGNERAISSDNCLFLMPPGKEHSFHNTGRLEAQNIYIGFSYSFSPELPLREDLPLLLPTDNPSVSRTLSLFNELTKPMTMGDLRYTLNIKRREIIRCVLHIVNWMIDSEAGHEGGSAVRTMLLIDRIKEYIMDNLDKHISVDELAKQLYLSPNYLGQVFRQYTGTTVKNYHNQMRMDTALRMIISGDKTISEIADEMGFESIAYFSRRFKMSYGISPSQVLSHRGALPPHDDLDTE
ncbi:MAG: AraC family transcriptional regulator [Oscillospiraceae bacterium]|nr:AraC family transcriptional regulator [Oscillospiraceae bacterium]